MDWNLKAAAWHLSEFEPEAIPDIVHTFDRSSSSGEHRRSGEFSIDLRLGQIGNPGDKTTSKVKQPGTLKMESSPSGTAKRARGASNGAQVMCLVDGCNSDLSTCRDYHRRHKVCERHSKTPQVTIGGQKQRFCQQCSRFHSLEEFDEGKRSCRKRLDGHNRRRRKPPPDPLPRPGSFLSNYQAFSAGTQLLPYSSSHAYPSAAVVNPTWSSAVVNNEADARNYNLHRQMHSSDHKQSFFLGSSTSSSFKSGKQFPFLQSDNNLTLHDQTSPAGASVCQPLLRSSIALSESIGVRSSRHGMLCESLTTQPGDSDCALSLLSSTQTQASGNHIWQPSTAPLVQRIDSRQHQHSLTSMDSVLVSNTRDPQVDCQGLLLHFQSGNKTPHPLPFHWE